MAGLFTVIKLVGAVCLVHIGCRTFMTRARVDVDLSDDDTMTRMDSLRTGFPTNALNPKTTLFVVSAYTQVIGPESGTVQQIGYGLFMSFAHWAWFSLAALLFSSDRLRTAMLRGQVVLNRVIGSALVGPGLALALSPAVG